MPITVEWDNPQQTAVLFTYNRPWTWKEFDAAVEQTIRMIDAGDHRVDVIFDLRKGGFPPRDAVQRFKEAAEITHPNLGQYVYVAPSMLVHFVKNVIQILNRAYSFGGFEVPSIVFTKSPEEAREFLARLYEPDMETGN